jgi:hypothetical protein
MSDSLDQLRADLTTLAERQEHLAEEIAGRVSALRAILRGLSDRIDRLETLLGDQPPR